MDANTFSVSDRNTAQACVNALNTSFDSIKGMLESYEPRESEQQFAILYLVTDIVKDSTVKVSPPCEGNIPVYCQYGSQNMKVGRLSGDTVTFDKDMDGTYLIYQPYRKAIVQEPMSLSSSSRYYSIGTKAAQAEAE